MTNSIVKEVITTKVVKIISIEKINHKINYIAVDKNGSIISKKFKEPVKLIKNVITKEPEKIQVNEFVGYYNGKFNCFIGKELPQWN